MKKLAILIYSLDLGGAERVVSILLNNLKDKYDIHLILMNKSIKYKIPKKQKIYYIENSIPNESGLNKLIKLPILAFKYKQYCNKNKIDISISFMNRPNYINILTKLFNNKSKIVISERSLPSLQHKYGIQGKVNRFLIKYLYNRADLIIANSLGNTKDLIKNFNILDTKTLNNPFNISKIVSESNEKVNFRDDKFTFITIGRLDSGKNHALQIDAMKNIDAKLYIIGDGELREVLNNKIIENKLTAKVILLGNQKNPYKFLSKSDCFLFSSNNEGFPNVLVEALACNLPIISTDCKSGPREILSKYENDEILKKGYVPSKHGILTTINNLNAFQEAMKLIMENESLKNHYKNKALSRAQDFDLKIILKQFNEMIEKV